MGDSEIGRCVFLTKPPARTAALGRVVGKEESSVKRASVAGVDLGGGLLPRPVRPEISPAGPETDYCGAQTGARVALLTSNRGALEPGQSLKGASRTKRGELTTFSSYVPCVYT